MEPQAGLLWRVRLFGGPTLESNLGRGEALMRFRSAKVAGLLSYLAIHLGQPCSRETLMEALWPEESDFNVIANRFRVTLASLRRQLEPDGFGFGAVLDTSVVGCIRLRPEAVWCDLTEFDRAIFRRDLAEAATLMTGRLLPGLTDEWLSDHQMRIELLREEVEVHRALAPEPLPRDLAPPSRHRLPLFLTSFFDRKSDLLNLGPLVEGHRLVTLTGTGGVGKTRLSVEICSSSDRPTTFVPLAECADREGLCERILQSLSVGTETDLSPEDQVEQVLSRQGSIRLILDNAEHLVDEVSPFILSILDKCPQVFIFVTSRQALEITGEHVYRLDPLPCPPEGEAANEKDFSSIELFIDRARLSRADSHFSKNHLTTIAAICRRLEGLPLAIELAAAQISVHSLRDILIRLEHSLLDLKSRQRSLSTRHRSLRAVIQSSVDGLDEETARFLGFVAVFWGGFTEESALAVSGDGQAGEHLQELAARSLITAHHQEPKMRFACLEAVRELAQERLAPADLEFSRRRHREHFLDLAARIDENAMATFHGLDQEEQNLQVALENPDYSSELFWEACRGVVTHAFVLGQHRSATKLIRESWPFMSLCPSRSARIEWWNVALHLLADTGPYWVAEDMLVEMRAEVENVDDSRGRVLALIIDGLLRDRQDDFAGALSLHREALAKARLLGDQGILESALAHLSGSLKGAVSHGFDRSNVVEASELARELMLMVGADSRRYPLAFLLGGSTTYTLNQLDVATDLLDRAVLASMRLGLRGVRMYASFYLADIARQKGNLAEAARNLDLFRSLQMQSGIILGPDEGRQAGWFEARVAEIENLANLPT